MRRAIPDQIAANAGDNYHRESRFSTNAKSQLLQIKVSSRKWSSIILDQINMWIL